MGNMALVTLLLSKKAKDSLKDTQGAIPLHYASQGNHREAILALLKSKTASDSGDHEGRTALMWAVSNGSFITNL